MYNDFTYNFQRLSLQHQLGHFVAFVLYAFEIHFENTLYIPDKQCNVTCVSFDKNVCNMLVLLKNC